MIEDDSKQCHQCPLPTEILIYIFTFLPAKDLTKSRQVCSRWKYVIDGLYKSDIIWREHCRKDFKDVHKTAHFNARAGVSWFNLYKSLSLWAKLPLAREIRDEFASASKVPEEIIDFKVLPMGIIGVHKKASIVYYDIETLEVSKRGPITGNYLRYAENANTIVILGYQLHLYIIRKIVYNSVYQANTSFDNIKSFLLTDTKVFLVTIDDDIYVVDLEKENLQSEFLNHSVENVMCLGYSNNRLYVLTLERNIYVLVGNQMPYVYTLGRNTNLLHILKKYNLLENLDWKIYFQWIYVLNQTVPQGPLRDIIVIRCYGDMVFVGSNWGVLRIYHTPYFAGELDLYKAEPVKQYNFMERQDCPVLSDPCPIVQIDVLEGEDGHILIAAMPKKIAVLYFIHSFKRTASVAMLPYREVQRVKILKIDDSV